jgi:hypothetical protein
LDKISNPEVWMIAKTGGCLAVLVWIGLASAAQAALINLSYPSDPRSTGSFSTAEQAVFNQAANEWQTALPGPGTVSVVVIKSNPSAVPQLAGLTGFATDYAGSLGFDPTSGRQLGNPVAGTILINDAVSFFVDPTPAGDSEYQSVPGAPPTYLWTTSGPAHLQTDLLSTMIHEIGHVLGFTSSYESFWLNVMASPNIGDAGRPAYAFVNPPSIGDPALDYLANPADPMFLVNGGVFLIRPGQELEALVNQGVASHTDAAGGPGLAAGYFPFDALNPGLALSERRHVSFADADILCDAFGAPCGTVIPEPSTLLLVVGSLVALSILRIRPCARLSSTSRGRR